MTKKTLIIDCDGVLYPASMLTLQEFVDAMKNTYRDDLKVDSKTQAKVSEQTISKQRVGMFNYINEMCLETGYNFDDFCLKMQEKINYEKISRDDSLFKLLKETATNHNVVILTNNHISHLDKVLNCRFGKNIQEMQDAGISCYDIKSTMRDGVFYPKQDPQALSMFAEKIGASVSDCVLIDDTKRNIDAAKHIGMQAVLIDENSCTLKNYLNTLNSSNIILKQSNTHDRQ